MTAHSMRDRALEFMQIFLPPSLGPSSILLLQRVGETNGLVAGRRSGSMRRLRDFKTGAYMLCYGD